MLIIRPFPRTDNRLTRFAASAALLALCHFSVAQAGEQATPLPPGTITVEDTHYPKAPLPYGKSSAEDMVNTAKRNVGQIDRELRKDTPPSEPTAAATALNKQQILEKGLAPEVAPKEPARPGETTMEDITRPDGLRVTKVTGPNGTYCVTQISVGNTKGEDIIQRGAISRTTSCGSGF
ncbi:hypothetical protein LT85_4234 [Collimonas arenae]|uniref:Uncharacterized protein n=1 Tax=Collimonas arenae TaxID=279058 RepID=A0A0A1FKH5_9BURK|nr:hypothetical protein [Collimonas arenae]AIY43392.1 hypothetical protein LT85_4234 [Collimonas arenae]